MHPLLSGPLTLETLTIPIRDLPTSLDGTVIVQLSDFHYDGLRLSDQLLGEVIERVQDIHPDLIVLTGDFVTEDPAPIYPLVRRLKQMPSRGGIFACLGNHDLVVEGARETITQALERADIQVLWNQMTYPLDPGLALVGLPDFWSREFKLAHILAEIPPEIPRIVLSHNPDSAEKLQAWRVDLQLSGHTHGGQIVFPGLGNAPQLWDMVRKKIPANLRKNIPYLSDRCFKVVSHWEWSMGLHQVGENRLYVNRGLGTYLPGRLFCNPEITMIILRPQGVETVT